MNRFGVFGGTFDPVHFGHLRAATEVAEALDLPRVLLVPSSQPPHKESDDDDPMAPADLRLEWVERVCGEDPRFEACDLELRRSGASYTIDTLRELAAREAGKPVFVIGSDAFALVDTWRSPSELFGLADFAVMTRPGTPGDLRDWIPAKLRGEFEIETEGGRALHAASGGEVRAVEISALEISSTDIRGRLRAGRSIRYLVPTAVRRDIEAREVYALGKR